MTNATDIYFLTFLEARSPRGRFQPLSFWWEISSWFNRQLHRACACVERKQAFGVSFYKDANSIGLGSHPMTLFNLNYFFMGYISKYTHVVC